MKVNLRKFISLYLPIFTILLLISSILLVFNMSGGKQNLLSSANFESKVAILKTNRGDITIELNSATPIASSNFVKLAKSGFYDGTKFHRVINGLFIQGGDPFTKNDDTKSQWGHGGPGYTFADEIHKDDKMVRGVVAMANNGPNTNGSQFFILAAKEAALYNGKHTIFGKVINGMEIVDLINLSKVTVTDIPLENIIIEKVIIVSS